MAHFNPNEREVWRRLPLLPCPRKLLISRGFKAEDIDRLAQAGYLAQVGETMVATRKTFAFQENFL